MSYPALQKPRLSRGRWWKTARESHAFSMPSRKEPPAMLSMRRTFAARRCGAQTHWLIRRRPSEAYLFDGTLKSYYEHLYRGLGAEAGWVADVIALVNFA